MAYLLHLQRSNNQEMKVSVKESFASKDEN